MSIDKSLTEKDIVASHSKEIADDLKEILSSLKKVMENGEEIQPGDKRLFSLLLKNLRTKVQIELFNKLLDNNPDYASLSATIDAKIKDFKKELKTVVEKNNNSLNYNSSQERVLERLIKSLESSKKDLDEKNVISASTHLLKNYNIQEIIDNCSTSLALGYKDFNPFFGTDLIKSSKQSYSANYDVDYKTLNKVVEVIREDKSVRDEIVDYYKFVQACDKEKSILEKNEGLLHLLQAVEPYADQLAELYQNSLDLAEEEKEKARLDEEKDVTIPEAINKLQNNLVSGLLNSRKINLYISQLYYVEQDLKTVEDEIDSINGTNDKIVSQILADARAKDSEAVKLIKKVIGLKDYIVEAMEIPRYQLPHDYSDDSMDYSWLLQLFIDILKKNNTFDKSLERMNKLVETSTKTLTKKENKKAAAYEKLSSKAKKYADSDIYSARACVGILDRQPKYDRTPVICAFILHILGQSRKISFDDLLEVVTLSSNVDIAKIEEEYNDIINRHVSEVRKTNEDAINDYEKYYGEVDTQDIIEEMYETGKAVDITEEQIDLENKVLEQKARHNEDLVPDDDEIEDGRTIFEQEEYAPYSTPQMGEAAYAKRVEVVDQYLGEKFGYSRSSKHQDTDDKAKLL